MVVPMGCAVTVILQVMPMMPVIIVLMKTVRVIMLTVTTIKLTAVAKSRALMSVVMTIVMATVALVLVGFFTGI